MRVKIQVKAILNDGLIFPTKMPLRHLTTRRWMVRPSPLIAARPLNIQLTMA